MKEEKCERCDGWGLITVEDEEISCSECNGTGTLVVEDD